MPEVETTHGLIERERLVTRDTVTEEENARVTVTEWFLGEECVRRDCWVSLLKGLAMGVKGDLGG